MPRKNFVQVKLPPQQPDSCVECPLLGLVPEHMRPPRSKETHVCIGTMEALTGRGVKVKASAKDKNHPLRRPCDRVWHAWMDLPDRKIGISLSQYNQLRQPYERTLQLQIKFHR